MRQRTTILLATIFAITLIAAGLPTSGHHDNRLDDRIVQPYGVRVFTHVPVIAGYEPMPAPPHCLPGASQLQTVHHETFDEDHGYSFITTPLAENSTNLWHITDWAGPGDDGGHSQDRRLYFGLPTPSPLGIGGTYHLHDFEHVAGTAQSPPLRLPEADELALSFDTKWAVEWLKGYDHMWVELLDEDGDIHLLCTANSLDRPEATSGGNQHRVGSCSPILLGPCPTGHPVGSGPNEYPLASLPGWETREVPIPSALSGQEIRLRFTFDTSDGVANQFMGWMVDDVRILAP